MRLNIDLDEELLRKVMRDGNYPTKEAAVEDALYVLIHGRLKPKPAHEKARPDKLEKAIRGTHENEHRA